MASLSLLRTFSGLIGATVALQLSVSTVLAQGSAVDATAESQSSIGAEALRVFLDCSRCDFDYLRTEITFVNYVRDRPDAQVHVLVTRENTGGGGAAVTLDFFGLEGFEDLDDQLTYFTTQNDTDDDERRQLAQTLRLGLVRYAAQTPLRQELEVLQRERGVLGIQPINAQADDDPWNFWVFRTRFNIFLDGEELESTKSLNGSFSANRTTDAWKMNLGINLSYREDTFELTDSTFTNIRRDSAVTARFVKSLGEHVGFGFGGSAVTSSFRNQDLTVRGAPAVEYNFFPYAESTRRQFTVSYSVGYNSFDYEEVTLFGKTHETRADHTVRTSFDVNEPWGDADLTVEWSQFLDEPSQNRLVFFGDLEIRLFRGFFLNINGSSSLLRDQIYLPRRDATDQEILVRQRQLATDYEWRLRIGITYSFGSIFNNVVNSRFAGSNGGFIRVF